MRLYSYNQFSSVQVSSPSRKLMIMACSLCCFDSCYLRDEKLWWSPDLYHILFYWLHEVNWSIFRAIFSPTGRESILETHQHKLPLNFFFLLLLFKLSIGFHRGPLAILVAGPNEHGGDMDLLCPSSRYFPLAESIAHILPTKESTFLLFLENQNTSKRNFSSF